MLDEQHDYAAYLLRLWRVNQNSGSANAVTWHASLEQVASGERIGFADLDALFRYLSEEVKQHDRVTLTKERSLQNE